MKKRKKLERVKGRERAQPNDKNKRGIRVMGSERNGFGCQDLDGMMVGEFFSIINYIVSEYCDGFDNDCDAQVDEFVQNTYYQDSDSDNYGNADGAILVCTAPLGYVSDNTDCNDNNILEFPGQTWYKDADNDGYSDGVSLVQCPRPTGYRAVSELISMSRDCDDNNAALNPTTGCPSQTCFVQGGDVCSVDEFCPGNVLSASDTNRCCSVQCASSSGALCSDCGVGLLNICDRAECNGITEAGGCYFNDGIVGGQCSSCGAATSCVNYGDDQQTCTEIPDSCSFGNCVWNSNTNLCEVIPPQCGNGICDSGENSKKCPADCKGSPGGTKICGNGICESGETRNKCPADCT